MDKKGNVLDRLFLSFAKAPGVYEGPSFIFMELNKCEAAGEVGETIYFRMVNGMKKISNLSKRVTEGYFRLGAMFLTNDLR